SPMKLLRRDVDASNNDGLEIWYFENPNLGSNSVAVNLSGTANFGMGLLSYALVRQGAPFGAVTFTNFTANANTFAGNLTTAMNNSLVLSNFESGKKALTSLGAGQTGRWLQVQSDNYEGDEKAAPAPGLVTTTYNIASPAKAGLQMVELVTGCAPTVTPTFTATNTSTNTPTSTPTLTSTSTATDTVTM